MWGHALIIMTAYKIDCVHRSKELLAYVMAIAQDPHIQSGDRKLFMNPCHLKSF